MEGDDDFLYRPKRAKGQRLDPAIKRIAIVAGSVSFVVILVAWAWSGIHPYAFGPPAIINPPTVPLRIVPTDPGGMELPEADVPIMSGDSLSNTDVHLAAPGEAPDVSALDQEAGLASPTSNPPANGAAALQSTSNAADEVADEPKNITPAVSQTPKPGSTATSAAQAEGLTSVQLAQAGSEDKILAVWVQLQQKFSGVVSGRQPELLPSIINGQSVWYLRLGGFNSTASAQAFCNALTSKGAACSVVTF